MKNFKQKNQARKKVSSIIGKIFTVNILLLFNANVLLSQHARLVNANNAPTCSDYIYLGVKNPMRLILPTDKDYDLNKIGLLSDSVIIERKNDSIFYLRPKFRFLHVRVYVVDALTKAKYDSIAVLSEDQPFGFYLDGRIRIDAITPRVILFAWMKKLHFRTINSCNKFDDQFSLINYEIVLKRGDSIMCREKFNHREYISEKFKQEINRIAKAGDVIYAENINLKSTYKVKLKIQSYSLFRFR